MSDETMSDPTELYLVRHAIAAEPGPAFPDDRLRPLTSRGIRRLQRSVHGLAALDVRFDQIFTSPYVRTRQTADVIAEAMAGRPPVLDLEALAPGGSTAGILDALAREARGARIALIGHEPLIGELAGRLIGARLALEFRKGSLCRIDVDGLPLTRPGRLRWFLPPRILRQLGRT